MELINSVHEYSEPQVKKLAEQAAWDFLAAKKPAFDLTVNNPDITIDPMLQPINGAKTKASNQRIILAAELITPQLVLNTIRKHFPQLDDMKESRLAFRRRYCRLLYSLLDGVRLKCHWFFKAHLLYLDN
jgi:hypothetical protein